VVEHALKSTSHEPLVIGYDDKVESITELGKPAVILCHGRDGVYLMSNGRPRDIIDESNGRSYVAYAEDFKPRNDTEWRAKSTALLGGDDFAKTLPWAGKIKEMIDEGTSEIVIEFSAGRVCLVQP
jgi:hypothetical protein